MNSSVIQLTDKEKILLHLRDYINQTPPYPVALSQEGISEITGIPLPHIPRAVKSLIQERFINESKDYIQGAERRRNAYTLTADGAFKVGELRDRLNEENVVVDKKKIKIKEVNKYLGKQYKLLTIIQNIKDGVFDYHNIEKKKVFVNFLDKAPKFRTFFDRENEQSIINKWLSTPSSSILVLHGIAGIGKTSLGLNCVSRFKDKRHIFWHNCREYDSVESIMDALADFLVKSTGNAGLREYLLGRKKLLFDLRKAYKMFVDGLQKGTILFFDDFHRSSQVSLLMTEFSDCLSRENKEESKEIKILITSRKIPDFYNRSDVILMQLVDELQLKGLSEDVCRQWMESEGLELSETVFHTLYSLIRGHPLSMELVLSRREDLMDYSSSVRKYMYEEIFSKLTDEEIRILQIASLSSRALPLDAFEANMNVLEGLVRRSLLIEREGKYEIHEAIASSISEKIHSGLREKYEKILKRLEKG